MTVKNQQPRILLGMERADLERMCETFGVKTVHARRVFAHVFRHGKHDIRCIPGLPRHFSSWLEEHTQPLDVSILAMQNAADGTRKLLLAMPDGREVETVIIPGKGRLTQCISTQIGCAAGCAFCLTATAGLVRNLSAAEMVAQVMACPDIYGRRARNLVLMGMGEPMHNYEEMARFIRIVTDPQGLAFSPRRVTASSAGHVPGIRRMARDRLPCNLALSLNATSDEVRNRIMPINRRWPIAEVLHWAGVFAREMRKRILIEYVMLAGINDSDADARRLTGLLENIPGTINLLPFNEFAASPFRRPDVGRVSAFRRILSEAGKVAVVRESRGRDISAACGQLRTEVRRCRAAGQPITFLLSGSGLIRRTKNPPSGGV